jgi:hypothetical protein
MTSTDDPLVRTAMDADTKRFPPNAEFEVWCFLAAWKLEEVTALSMGIDPRVISREIIKGLGLIPHPHMVKTAQDALRLSPRAAMYEDRLRHLERACEAGDVENVRQSGGAWEVRPLDFLGWFHRHVERHGERYPWNGLHPLFVRQVKKDHPATSNAKAASSTAPHGARDTGEKAPAARASASAVLDSLKDRSGKPLKEKTGVIETWKHMRGVITTPHERRKCKYPTMKELKEYCERKFKVAQNDSAILASAASELPGAIRYRRGAPGNSKVS